MKPVADCSAPASVLTVGFVSSLMTASAFVGLTVSTSLTFTATIAPLSSVARARGGCVPATVSNDRLPVEAAVVLKSARRFSRSAATLVAELIALGLELVVELAALALVDHVGVRGRELIRGHHQEGRVRRHLLGADIRRREVGHLRGRFETRQIRELVRRPGVFLRHQHDARGLVRLVVHDGHHRARPVVVRLRQDDLERLGRDRRRHRVVGSAPRSR